MESARDPSFTNTNEGSFFAFHSIKYSRMIFYQLVITTEHTEYTEEILIGFGLSVWSVYSVVKRSEKRFFLISTIIRSDLCPNYFLCEEFREGGNRGAMQESVI